ncbi:MAG: GH39 family glycosyl hydrolase [Nitrospirota bacterium]
METVQRGSAKRRCVMQAICMLVACGVFFLASLQEGAAFFPTGDTVAVTIDLSRDDGETPTVFRPGLMGTWWNKIQPLQREISGLKQKPFWRLHLAIGTDSPGGDKVTKPVDFEENFIDWMNSYVNPRVKEYQDAGYQVVISLTQVPRWLSLYPYDEGLPYSYHGSFLKWSCSPPKDYAAWKQLIALVVQTQKEYGITADYLVGDEPDWTFYGTTAQYLAFYHQTSDAIKEVDQNLRVGAPGVSRWTVKKSVNCPAEATGLPDGECPSQALTLLEDLIRYAGANKVPLDFIDWHFPDIETVGEATTMIRALLKANGLSETIPLTIGEWVFSSDREDESTEKASAYAVHLLRAMEENGISRHSATSLYDQEGWENGDWAHVGFFSADGVIRPKWNAFKAIDRVTGTRIEAETEDRDHIAVISARENKTIRILAAHFLKNEEVALQAALDSFSSQSSAFIQTCTQKIPDGEKIFSDLFMQYLMGEITDRYLEQKSVQYCGSFPDYLKSDVINSRIIAAQVYRNEIPYQAHPREVHLNVTNISPGNYILKKYLIDGDRDEIHANPCRYNKQTEGMPTDTECGIQGAIDEAVSRAREDARASVNDFLLSAGYSQKIADRFATCLSTPGCSPEGVVDTYCIQYPAQCERFRYDLRESRSLFENLFFHGTYTTDNGMYSISTFIDQINNLREVSLEGSKVEQYITVSGTVYTETFLMQPYSVVLIELSQ